MSETIRLTVAQALVRFLSNQFSERDGVEYRLVTGIFGIFGHGNVAGVGQAMLQDQVAAEAEADGSDVEHLPYLLARNEQGAVHAATAYARTRNRLQTMAVTTSIGPGATNMVTGAALASTNRIPVLLFPSDQFATRIPVFLYLTDYRERTLKDVITQLEPALFKRVTGLTVKDFELLVSLGLFNSALMNDAVYKFKRYEDSSLEYTGINRHTEKGVGLYDTVLSREDYQKSFVNEEAGSYE